MTENLFLDWAIKLLEQIETSEEKKLWCYVARQLLGNAE